MAAMADFSIVHLVLHPESYSYMTSSWSKLLDFVALSIMWRISASMKKKKLSRCLSRL